MDTCDDDLGDFESSLKDDIPEDFCDLVGEVYFLMSKGELLLSCKFCDENFLTAPKFLSHLHEFHLFIRPPRECKSVLSNKVEAECINEHMHMDSRDECLKKKKSVELKDDLNPVIPQRNTELNRSCSFLPAQTFQEQTVQEQPAEPNTNLIKSLSNSNSFLKYSEEQESREFVTSSGNFNEYQQNSELPTTLISNYEEEQNIVFNGNIHQELPAFNHIFQSDDKINNLSTLSELVRVGAQQYDTINNEINKQAMVPLIETQQGQEFVCNDNTILYNNISTADLYIRYNEADGTYDLINCNANLFQAPVIPEMNQDPNENNVPLINSDYNLVEREVDNIANNIFVEGNIDEAPLIERSEDIGIDSIENETENIYSNFSEFSDIRNEENYQELTKCKSNSQPVDDNKTAESSNPVASNLKWQEQKKDTYIESFQNFLKCENRLDSQIENTKLKNDKPLLKNFNNNNESKAQTNSCSTESIEKKLHCRICSSSSSSSSSRGFSNERNLKRHLKTVHGKSPNAKCIKMDETYTELTTNGCSPIMNSCNSMKHKNNHNNYKENLDNQSENNVQKNILEVNSISEYSNHLPNTTETNSPSKYLNHSNHASLNNEYYDMQTDEIVTEVIIDNNDVNLDYNDLIPLESEEQSNIDVNVT